MLRLIRKYYTMYFSGAMGFLVIVALATMGFHGASETVGTAILIAGFALLVAWAMFCSKRANACYARILRILDEQCDPEAFLEAQRVIYRRACGTKRIRSAAGMNAAVVRMNHAVGLSFAGRHKEAVEELQAILALPVKKNKDYLHSLCHVNLAMFLARRGEDGDIAAAREHIRKAGEHLKGIGQSNSALSGEIVRAEYMADTAEGKNSEAALEYFSKNLKNASVVRAEAAYRYQLALIYRRQGDNNSERTHLEFVAQTAPKAYIGKQAAARLAELSA